MRVFFFALVLFICLSCSSAWVLTQGTSAPAPVDRPTFQDPAVPMIALPTRFSTHRVNSSGGIPDDGSFVLANLEGPGCIRHIWILFGKDRRLEINVDGAEKSQVDVPLKSFFGVMHDLDPYFVDCAAYTVLPNPVFGKHGNPGYNLYLPIPFSKSCRITLHGAAGQAGAAMVDWHKYDKDASLTPYRLHVDHRLYKPSPPRGGYVEMANIDGEGFVAGVVMGYIQRDKSNMVFHTGGMAILLDGETDPHAIQGHNVEDDFGFTWGFNDRQSRWIGCPWHENRGGNDQDGVFYRFFGPDPIAFRSSLSFRTGCRGDDMESVVYTYRVPGTTAPKTQSPSEWRVKGLFMPEADWDAFQKSEYIEDVAVDKWPVEPDRRYPAKDDFRTIEATLQSDHGWIDLQNVFFERNHGYSPRTVLDRCAYARTSIKSDAAKQATLRLAVDDWAVAWFNGEKVAALRHDDGLKVAKIPVALKKGINELLVKTNNTQGPSNHRLWVISCFVE